MKKIKLIVTALLIAVLAAVCVSAATVTHDLEYIDEESGLYGVSFHFDMEKETADGTVVGTYTTRFTYNTEKFVLMNLQTFAPVSNYYEERMTPIYPVDYGTKFSPLMYNFADPAEEGVWNSSEEGKMSGYITAYTQSTKFDVNDTLAFYIAFMLADGVTREDIYEEDFVIDSVYIKDTANNVEYGYQYTGADCEETLTVVNNVGLEAPVVSEDWVAGAGYLIDEAASATTKTETSATKVSVSHGGYYTGADNWGGVASKKKVTVDGLEIEVAYTSVPESSDCWMYIGVLENPSIFVASKTATYNKGYVNLIRYSQDRMVAYGTDTWDETGVYGKGTGFFAIKARDVLRVCFAKNAQGTYDVTYIKNNTELLEGPKGLALDDKAHVVVSASAKDSAKDAFAYTVDTAPAALKVAEIPVNAGDVVYKAGSKIAPVEIAEDGTYNIVITEANCGTYIVNTGYTAQVGYVVAKTGVTKFALENGVLGSNNVAMREVAPQGIRFFGTVTQDVREFATLVEYGFIMTAESAYNALGNNYVLDMDLVSKNKAKKGVAYNGADLDKYYEIDVEKVVFAGVLHGIPADAAGVQTVIASRPYYKLSDGTVVYGEVTKASLYQIAKKIYDDDNYAASQAYAKTIIELVEGVQEEPEEPTEPENEIIIDVGSLYR